MAMAMVTSCFFLGSFHQLIRVRCNLSVFARQMHSTSDFSKIVLSKCVSSRRLRVNALCVLCQKRLPPAAAMMMK